MSHSVAPNLQFSCLVTDKQGDKGTIGELGAKGKKGAKVIICALYMYTNKSWDNVICADEFSEAYDEQLHG